MRSEGPSVREGPLGFLKELEDIRSLSLGKLATQSGVRLTDAAIQSDTLNGFVSEVGIYVQPTLLGLQEAAETSVKQQMDMSRIVWSTCVIFCQTAPGKALLC